MILEPKAWDPKNISVRSNSLQGKLNKKSIGQFRLCFGTPCYLLADESNVSPTCVQDESKFLHKNLDSL